MTVRAERPTILAYEGPVTPAIADRVLWRELFALAVPVWVEQALHIGVGVNDTYLANHLPSHAAAAGAAVGTITYFLWFLGLLTGAVGVGSTALIARARGSRHRRLANRVTGQSAAAALVIGVGAGLALLLFARPLIALTQLQGDAAPLALNYLRMLSVTLPFTMLMFIAGSCLRGGGDTVTPAVVMVIVDVVNVGCSFALCRGWFGLPVMGFSGIALGTIIAYVVGGVLGVMALRNGRGVVRLYLHRLRPHLHTIRRLVRINLPALAGDTLAWTANIGVIAVVNRADGTNVAAAAHMNTIRLESFSFLSGMAFATAAATLVGTALGAGDPARARRSANFAYLAGGGVMTLCGLLFVTLGHWPAVWLSPPDSPAVAELTAKCIRITGFIQCSFAANMIFGGSLRGAGDTLAVMCLNLASVLLLRLPGVLVVGLYLHAGLPAIWCVMAGELFVRGLLVYGRFRFGGWATREV